MKNDMKKKEISTRNRNIESMIARRKEWMKCMTWMTWNKWNEWNEAKTNEIHEMKWDKIKQMNEWMNACMKEGRMERRNE